MYADLKKIYSKTGLSIFAMATSYIVEKGVTIVSSITDEQIDRMEGNGLMTKEFVQDLVKTSREIATLCKSNPAELIMFCQAVDLYDTYHYANKVSKTKIEAIANNAVTAMVCHDYDGVTFNDLCEYLDCEIEDLESLEIVTKEEVVKYYKNME